MQTFRGIPVSAGIAMGRAFVLDDVRRRIPRRVIAAAQVDDECARLDRALEASMEELDHLRREAEQELGTEAASIFAFHQGMLGDSSLTAPMRSRIREQHVSAEFAVQEQFREVAGMFQAMGNTAFSTKVDDVWDLDHRVLRHLIGEHQSALADLDHQAIIVARDLTPSQAASMPRDRVLAFVTDFGGPTSHTAIFGRAMGLPAVVGVGRLTEEIEEHDEIIVDGETGQVVVRPDDATREAYEQTIARQAELRTTLVAAASLDAVTKDDVEIALQGNIEFGEEAAKVLEYGGNGVGLFRTEFLWLTSDHEPTEDEQYEAYRSAVEGSRGGEVTIRTFDLGADKYTQERALTPERNPFLGCRSIRYCLENQDMFRRQLRAILRASAHGSVRVMFPLVTNAIEFRRARMLLKDAMEDLAEEGHAFDPDVPVGMMVEVPAAAVMASTFAREVDFFSIGTNDLVQYTLAVDRTNEKVADLYTEAHPAVIRLIKEVVRASRRQGLRVSVCGEAAGEPMFAMLLIGLGLRSLSVTPSRIPYLKRMVRSVDIPACERLARTVGSFDSERQVTAYLRDRARKSFPEFVDGRSVDVVPGAAKSSSPGLGPDQG